MYYTGNTSPRDFSVYGSVGDFDDADCWSQEDDEIMQVIIICTIKILKIGTPEIITIIVLQLEQLDFTVQYCDQKKQTE